MEPQAEELVAVEQAHKQVLQEPQIPEAVVAVVKE
jgi:hypothetical protein